MLKVRDFFVEQFWGGHPNTFRSIFAWASISYAFFMVLTPTAFNNPGFKLMHQLAPVWLWALLFALHWAAISLAVIRKLSTPWQLGVNCYGFAIWSMYVILQDMSLGYFAINSAAERVLCIYSFWAIVRTGLGRRAEK